MTLEETYSLALSLSRHLSLWCEKALYNVHLLNSVTWHTECFVSFAYSKHSSSRRTTILFSDQNSRWVCSPMVSSMHVVNWSKVRVNVNTFTNIFCFVVRLKASIATELMFDYFTPYIAKGINWFEINVAQKNIDMYKWFIKCLIQTI